MNIFNLDLVVPIFSSCKFTYIFSVRVLTYIFEFFSNFVQLHDLVHFSIYLTGSIFLILACLGLITLTFVFFSGRAGKILDTAAKLIVIAAGSSNLYKNHGGGSGSGSNDKDAEDKKEKEKEEKEKEEKEKEEKKEKDNETNKTNESNSDNNTAAK